MFIRLSLPADYHSQVARVQHPSLYTVSYTSSDIFLNIDKSVSDKIIPEDQRVWTEGAVLKQLAFKVMILIFKSILLMYILL